MSTRRKASRGQSMVEFALTAPLLLLAIIGVVQFAYLAYGVNTISSGAREGARAAITAQSACLNSDPVVISSVKAATQGVAPVTIAAVTTGNPHDPGSYCEVTVTWAFQPFSGALPVPTSNIASTSRAYYNADLAQGAAEPGRRPGPHPGLRLA